MKIRIHDRRRGAALLLAIAVLCLVALLGLAFARMAAFERDGSHRHQLATRARFAAESGVERALAALAGDPDLGAVDHLGETWVCRDAVDAPVDRLLGPSFAEGTGPAGPRSGRLHDPSEEFVLRVADGHSRLDLSRLEAGEDGAVRVLDNLARIVPGLPSGLGRRLARAARPGTDLSWARRAVGEEAWSFLAPFVTAGNWRDPASIDPVGRSASPSGLAPAAVPRAPLNVNTAPDDLLLAQLWGLSADVPGRGAVAIDLALAGALAAELDRRRRERPFEGRSDLEAFLAGQIDSIPGFGRLEFGLVRAALDPNPRLLDYNPDASTGWIAAGRGAPSLALVDRSRLTAWTVEASFGSFGRWDVESLGRVVSREGEVLARAVLVVRTAGHAVRRHTTQADFESARADASEVVTWPESAGELRAGSELDGQVILTRSADPGRGRFEAPAASSFHPARAAFPEWRTSFDRRALLEGGERVADGIHSRRPEGEGVASYRVENLPLEEGAVEFWYKPDRGVDPARPLGLLRATHALGPDRGVHTFVYLYGGRLHATRTYFEGIGRDLAPIEVSRRTITWFDVLAHEETEYLGDATFAEVWYRKDFTGRELVRGDGGWGAFGWPGFPLHGPSGNWVGPYDPASEFHETRDLDLLLGEVSSTRSVVRRSGPSATPGPARAGASAALRRYLLTGNAGFLRVAQSQYAASRTNHPMFERRPEAPARYYLRSPDAYSLLSPWLVRPVDYYKFFQNGSWTWRGGRYQYEYAGGTLAIQAILHGLENVVPAPLHAHHVDPLYPPADGYAELSSFRSRTGRPEGWDLWVHLYEFGRFSTVRSYRRVERTRVERTMADAIPYLAEADVTADPRRGGVPDSNPFFASRAERSIPFEGRPHHWRHVRLEWTEGMDLALLLDGILAEDGRDLPTTSRFASREARIHPAIEFGAVQVDRVSPEPGVCTPAITGRAVRLMAGGTVEHLLAETGRPGSSARPEKFRSDGGAWYTGRFLARGARAVLAWSAPCPDGWRLTWMAGPAAGAGSMVPLTPAGSQWARLDDPRLARAREIHYRVEFASSGSSAAGDLAPYLDEVTLVVAAPIRIASWHWVP